MKLLHYLLNVGECLNIETNLTIEEILKARYLYRDGKIAK